MLMFCHKGEVTDGALSGRESPVGGVQGLFSGALTSKGSSDVFLAVLVCIMTLLLCFILSGIDHNIVCCMSCT